MERLSVECEPVVATDWKRRFLPLDWLVITYTAWILVFVTIFAASIEEPGFIVALHLFILLAMLLVPPRGASWENARESESALRRHVRGGVKFFRYGYPLLLILFFFEEVEKTVNAIRPEAPHWFESYLYAADRFVFGELPAVSLNPFVGFLQDEIMHGFYFSYYFVLIGGVALAYVGEKGTHQRHPGPGFSTTLTSAILAFFLCFVWYPFLPARGPWENPELMATMTPFQGIVFTPIIERIIEQGSVSGGCFPSSHVAGAWGIVFGLHRYHPRWARRLGFFAVGMSIACVYTRYHHAVDVPTGFLAGLAGALIAGRLTAARPSELPPHRR